MCSDSSIFVAQLTADLYCLQDLLYECGLFCSLLALDIFCLLNSSVSVSFWSSLILLHMIT